MAALKAHSENPAAAGAASQTQAAPLAVAASQERAAFIAGDRAGQYTIEQLEMMLEPLLASTHQDAPALEQRDWPVSHAFLFALIGSCLLWTGIAFEISRYI